MFRKQTPAAPPIDRAMSAVARLAGTGADTDYPPFAARSLARLVNILNDRAEIEGGQVSRRDMEHFVTIGCLTIDTAGTPDSVIFHWLSRLLTDHHYGMARYTDPDGAAAILGVSELCLRASRHEHIAPAEWWNASAEVFNASVKSTAGIRANNAINTAYIAAESAWDGAVPVDTFAANAAAYAAMVYFEHVDMLGEFVEWAIRLWRELAGCGTAV